MVKLVTSGDVIVVTEEESSWVLQSLSLGAKGSCHGLLSKFIRAFDVPLNMLRPNTTLVGSNGLKGQGLVVGELPPLEGFEMTQAAALVLLCGRWPVVRLAPFPQFLLTVESCAKAVFSQGRIRCADLK